MSATGLDMDGLRTEAQREVLESLQVNALTLRERLMRRHLPEEDVDVPGQGTLRMRALTRDEVKGLRDEADGDMDLYECMLISAALVDPEMSASDVALWSKGAPAGELVIVSGAVSRLSGLGQEGSKSGV